jgi:hypothetical protein
VKAEEIGGESEGELRITIWGFPKKKPATKLPFLEKTPGY